MPKTTKVRSLRGGRGIVGVVAVAAVALASAACSGNRSPEPAGSPAALPSDSAMAEAEEEAGVDTTRLLEAREEASERVSRLDEATRREFVELFGADPLGLSSVPENAARYEIPLETNDAVEMWIDRYTEDIRDRFATYLSRLGRYAPMIRPKLREAELPQDLIYLALIESGMNPNAYSHAHAVGIWQFIASTGRRYGLEVNYWVDERRDPEKATDAAVAFLSDLYDEFGSWYLAAAAYNGGPNRVRWGIERVGSDDFWDLSDSRVLRRETRNYVPKIIAAAIIAKNADRYGFGDVDPMEALRYDTATVPQATSMDVIAEAAGTTEDTVEMLNPQFRRHVTPPDETARVLLPSGHGPRFAANYAEIPEEERVTWLTHRVTRGQTMSGIADRYGTSVQAIRASNDGVAPHRLQIGQQLVIPSATRAPAAAAGGARVASLRQRARSGPNGTRELTVQSGDTLWTIARAYDVSTDDLMAWNDLENPVIRPGDELVVAR